MIEPIVRQKRSGLQVQLAVIHALILREMVTRFGHYRLGYLWALLEPAASIAIMVVLFGFVIERTIPSMSYPIFLLTGIVPWGFFSSTVNRSLGAIEANRGLFNYKSVKPIDTMIARCLLEVTISLSVYSIFFVVLWLFGDTSGINNLLLFIYCWGCLFLLTFGLSLMMMVFGQYFTELSKVVKVIFQALYFMSGILYSLQSIPTEYLKYILWNPVVHMFEFMRHAVHDQYPIDHVSLGYFSIATLVVLVLGLMVYQRNEKGMLTSS